MMKVFVKGLAGVLVGIGLCGSVDAADYDVAAYVWPAYQPEPRWAELGIFKKGIGEWQNVQEAVPKWAGHVQPLKPLWGYENEADPNVVERKIDAAVSHGVNVFLTSSGRITIARVCDALDVFVAPLTHAFAVALPEGDVGGVQGVEPAGFDERRNG